MTASSLTVKEVGEFGLIDRIRSLFPQAAPSVLVGIGDDVAVLRTSTGRVLLATCDCQIEGVHFVRCSVPAYALGQRAAAVNLSDIAAMGGNPLWALVSLMVTESTPVPWIEDLYRGLGDALTRHGAVLVGGNTAKHPDRIVIDVTVLGEADPDRVILRHGAQVGDLIVVTGVLGGSRAGLECLRWNLCGKPGDREADPSGPVSGPFSGSEGACVDRSLEKLKGNVDIPAVDERMRDAAVHRHRLPEPRLREGRLLAASGWVHAMVDVSDGLMGDLAHMCHASGVGAVIHAEAVPVDAACEAVAQAVGQDPLLWALYGGEDYELLAAVDPQGYGDIERALARSGAVPCRVIGRIVPQEEGIRCVRSDGSAVETPQRAWDHFRA